MVRKILQLLWKQKLILPAVLIAVFTGGSLYAYQKPEVEKPNVEVASAAEMVAAKSADDEEETEAESGSGIDKEDGTYQGTGTGYGGPITVEVTVKDKKIVSISILSASGETSSFLSRAKAVIDTMISQQKMDVDTVSGATFSSRGIIEAVKNALTGEKSTSSVAAASTAQNKKPTAVGTVKENKKWKDGTYEGTAQGFGGPITVQVTIKDGKIKSIKIKSAANETASYFNKAKKLTKTMVKKQSTNVDAVSGATFSSNGIIRATRNALDKAAASSSKKSSKKSTKKKSSSTKKSTSKAGKSGQFPYPDGVYYGTGYGYNRKKPIKVAVVIQDKTLKAVAVTENSETEDYFEKAKALLDTMVEKQSVDVDVVSGATKSSNGIISAVKDALASAAGSQETSDDNNSNEEDTTDANNGGTDNSGNYETDNSNNAETDGSTDSGTEEASKYKDGTYSASATCDYFDYTINVQVQIVNGKITSVTYSIPSDQYDEYNDECTSNAINGFGKYTGVAKQVINKQSADSIDAVSGATYSSKALASACKAALQAALAQ